MPSKRLELSLKLTEEEKTPNFNTCSMASSAFSASTSSLLESETPPVVNEEVKNLVDQAGVFPSPEKNYETSAGVFVNETNNSDGSVRSSDDSSQEDPLHYSEDEDQNSSQQKKSNNYGEMEKRKKTRNRRGNRENWKKEIAKKRRNEGLDYVAAKSKKTVCKRIMGPPCAEKCRLKCHQKFEEQDRKYFFDSFWQIGNVDGQRIFLRGIMETVEPQYRYVREGSMRDKNTSFFFYKNEKKIRVCKKFVTSTLCISDRVIRTVLKKTSEKGFVLPDGRGKHGHHFQIDEAVKESIRAHIDSQNSSENGECIYGGKTLAELHRDYEELERDAGRSAASYQIYRNVFISSLLSFFWTLKK